MIGRDACRTPMVWEDVEGAGFTATGVDPWLPVGARDRNVAAQRDDPSSILMLTHDLIALRKTRRILHGAYEPVTGTPSGVWAFRRSGGAFVALNLGVDAVGLDGVDGAIVIGSDRQRDGEVLAGTLELEPFEAVVAST
jgi:glycosidase